MPNLGDTYNILIKTSADDSGINKAKNSLQGLNTQTEKTSKLAGLASVAHTAFGVAAGVALDAAAYKAVGFAKSVVASFEDSQNTIAQTNAVLKSTGSVAGVTAKQVGDLATSWEHQTRFSDEAVRSAENMLLTFTNIKSNVFPETTQAVLDMSTAMHSDLQSTAIQVGKALQDPVRGVTALQRVGVRLTESQKDLVKQLVDVGDTAGAQKLILKELSTEFGGSAKAAGDTFAGSIEKLKNRWDDMKENMGQFLVNEGLAVYNWFRSVEPALREVWDKVANFLRPSINALRGEFEQFIPTGKIILNDVIKPLAIALGATIVGAIWLVVNTLNILMHTLQDIVQWVRNTGQAFAEAWAAIVGAWQAAISFFRNIWNSIKSGFDNAYNGMIGWAHNVVNAIIGIFKGLPGEITGIIKNLGSSAINGVKGALHSAHIPGFAGGVQNFSGGLALVGEKGPELVNLPRGASVYTNSQSREMVNSRSVHIDNVVITSPQASRSFWTNLDNDSLLVSKGLTPMRGSS